MNVEVATETKGSPQPTRRPWLWRVLRLLTCCALLVILGWKADLRAVARTLGAADWLMFLGICVVAFLDRVLMAVKWNFLLRSRGVRISHLLAVRLQVAGYAVGALTPGAIGTDAYRVVMLSHLQRGKDVLSSILIEREIGVTVVAGFAAAMLPVSVPYLGAE